MSIVVQGDSVRIEGVARVEDAEALSTALTTQPGVIVDLSLCGGLHSSVVQVLLVFRPAVSGFDANPDLARWLEPLLPKPASQSET